MEMDVYKRLAKRLDELPEGFPATPDGLELKILKVIFTPQDAEMAMKLTATPETAEEIALRLDQPLDQMQATLTGMAARGQIAALRLEGKRKYRMAPFVVGIYEYQRRERLTEELVHLFEQYLPTLTKKVGGQGPSLTRVIPVNAGIKAELDILPHEDARQIVGKAKSFRLQDCICRREQALLGKPCEHTVHICLQYSMEQGAYDDFNLDGEIISKGEAFKIIDQAEQEGLVHNTYNVEQAPGGFICNCCSCCCGLLRGLKEHEAPYLLARSRYVAVIDPDTCAACGVCAEERCPMEAIVEDGDAYVVQDQRCIGCGVCVLTCPTESITLEERPETEWPEIADNIVDWARRRLDKRSRM